MLALEFLGRDNQVAVSCADGYLTPWDTETYQIQRFACVGDIQVGLRFCPSMHVLSSWGANEFNHETFVRNVDILEVLRVLSDAHCEPMEDMHGMALPKVSRDTGIVEK